MDMWCNVKSINPIKKTEALTLWSYSRIILFTHLHTRTHCTHDIWWLVLVWVTTKEDHPRLRIAYKSYIWRVSKFYLLTNLLTRFPSYSSADSAFCCHNSYIKITIILIHRQHFLCFPLQNRSKRT